MDSETILNLIEQRYKATDELKDLFSKLGSANIEFDLQIDGVLTKIGAEASKYLGEKILELYDLDENGEIRQNGFDYAEY